MSYPFTPMPNFKDFKKTLEEGYGVKVEKLKGKVIKKQGDERKEYQPSQFVRKLDKRILYAHIPSYIDDEYVFSPDVLASLCRKLEIDPADFGLYLHK